MRRSARPFSGLESLAARAPFASPLAEELAYDVLERFLRYVRVDTQGAYRVPERPSTEKQLDLSRLLVEELREIGLADAELNEGFSVFATLSFILFKMIGVGLAAAILIDATIVRAVLLPATMKLLGDWNWYLPKWLEWLPQLEGEKTPEAPTVPAAGA